MKTWKQGFIGIVVLAFVFTACDDGNDNNNTTPETVATPTATLPEGTYTGTQSVTLSCTTAGADIYYTLDGTTPTASSTKYATAISITDNVTIKAIATKSGMNNSGVLTVEYTFEPSIKDFVTIVLFTAESDGRDLTANIKDERVNNGVQNLQELEIVTQIETAIMGAYNTGSGAQLGINRGRFRTVFAVEGGVTIIVNNPATPYTGALIPDSRTMTFHINYLQGSPADIQQQIINAVQFMIDPANFE